MSFHEPHTGIPNKYVTGFYMAYNERGNLCMSDYTIQLRTSPNIIGKNGTVPPNHVYIWNMHPGCNLLVVSESLTCTSFRFINKHTESFMIVTNERGTSENIDSSYCYTIFVIWITHLPTWKRCCIFQHVWFYWKNTKLPRWSCVFNCYT